MQASGSVHTYRPEIDGLRALAVLPVILFHAGFGLFSGGYVGVDVFFVISGYLITRIIVSEQAEGRFSLVRFYERRVRRIFPALFLVMLVSLPFAWFWLSPGDLKEFARSVRSVCLFVSNFFFYHKSDYFDTAAEFKPLLHTWSLAIEEQYYFLFPALVLLVRKYRPAALPYVLAVIGTASLAYAQYQVQRVSGAAYFLLPSRFWELAVGSFLALYSLRATPAQLVPSAFWRGILAFAGVVAILSGVFYFTSFTLYPSLYTLVPTVGAALVILFASPANVAGRFLSLRPVVFLGLISYSAYLWHQPMFAFARLRGYGEGQPGLFAALSVLCLVFACFSWRFVEQPFRKAGRFSRKRVFVLALLGSIFFLAVAEMTTKGEGFPDRLSPEQKVIYAYKEYDHDKAWRQRRCFLESTQYSRDVAAECFAARAGSSIAVWGDSYAATFAASLRTVWPQVTQLSAQGCPPVMAYDSHINTHCSELNQYIFAQLVTRKPVMIVMHANWMLHPDKAIERQLVKTVAQLRAALPKTRIYVMGNLPQWSPSLPDVLLRHEKLALDGNSLLRNYSLVRLTAYDARLRAAAEENGGKFISAADRLCQGDHCRISAELNGKREISAWDYGHLTFTAATWLALELLASDLALRR